VRQGSAWELRDGGASGARGEGNTSARDGGRGVDGLRDGGARARGRRRRGSGTGRWCSGTAPRLRFGAVEWRLRFGARARGKKGKQGSTVGSSPHPVVLMIYTVGSSPHPAVLMIYTAGPIHNQALLSPCRHFTCPLHSRQSGGIYVYFIQDKVEANMAAIHSRHIINKFYTIRSGGI